MILLLTALSFLHIVVQPERSYHTVSSETKLSWLDAQAYCQSEYGTDLATIYDDDSALQLYNLRLPSDHTWIGLNDIDTKGVYEWGDGTLCSSEYSDSCAPKNGYPYWTTGASGSSDCVRIRNDATNYLEMLDDLYCSATLPFICNHPTQSPTLAPTSPSLAPTHSPTSSCLDYKNQTSDDGDVDQLREFNDKHVTNIDNYFMNGTFVSEFNSSHDNYKQKLIECVASDCIIHCNHSASCLETSIEINIQNKTTLLLCDDDYSCPGASVKTQSGSIANITIVCIGRYS
eukprot:44771_1